jgi:hypothetical protein
MERGGRETSPVAVVSVEEPCSWKYNTCHHRPHRVSMEKKKGYALLVTD